MTKRQKIKLIIMITFVTLLVSFTYIIENIKVNPVFALLFYIIMLTLLMIFVMLEKKDEYE